MVSFFFTTLFVDNMSAIFQFPIREPYTKSQGFGENPEFYKPIGLAFHNGDDYACKTGTAIYAVADGIVTSAESKYKENDKTGYGNQVGLLCPIDEANVYYDVIYGHLLAVYVALGQEVRQGQLLGLTDNTGFSTGPHLHFGARKVMRKTAQAGDSFRIYLGQTYVIENGTNGVFGYVDPTPLFQDAPGKEVFPVDLRYGQAYSYAREKTWALLHEKYAIQKCKENGVPYDARIKNAFVYGFWDAFTRIEKNQYGVFDPAMYSTIMFMPKPEFMKKLGTAQGWGAKINPQ